MIVTLNGREIKLPDGWPDVSEAMLPKLVELLFVRPENGDTYLELLRVVCGFTTGEWKQLHRTCFAPDLSEEVRENNAEVLQTLLTQIRWMWTSDFTRKPFQSVHREGVEYLLPEEAFRSMTYGEMVDAFVHAHTFCKQLIPGPERLHYLLATILRPRRKGDYTNQEGWNGDHREAYNVSVSKERVDLFVDMPFVNQIGVLVYFLGSLKDFFSQYELYEEDTIEANVAEDEYPGQSMIKNLHFLAGKGIFGNQQQTKNTNVHEVFLYLEEHKKDIKEEIANLKKQNGTNTNQ